MNKKPLVIFIVFSTLAIIFTALVGMIIIPEFRMAERLEIREIDIRRIPDGTYHGRAETIMAAAEVLVTVEGRRIAGIDLVDHVHTNGEVAEVVLDWVLEEQCLKVDVVSGATYSSLVLLKAVENALYYEQQGR